MIELASESHLDIFLVTGHFVCSHKTPITEELLSRTQTTKIKFAADLTSYARNLGTREEELDTPALNSVSVHLFPGVVFFVFGFFSILYPPSRT